MGLKKIYFAIESKYYDFVEKTGLYKITDKIDKVMPSFIFFILLLLIIIAGIFLLIPHNVPETQYNQINFTVKDADTGDPLPGVSLQISTVEDIFTLQTDDSGITESIYVPKDTDYTVDIDYKIGGYTKLSKSYISDEDNKNVILVLEPIKPEELVTYNFSVVDDSTSQRILESGVASFSCSNGGIAPSPVDIINGRVSVDVDPNCDLLADITINGYQTVYDQPIIDNTYIHMTSQGASFTEKFTLTLYAKTTSGISLPNIKFIAYNQGIPSGQCITNDGGSCQITGLEPTNYEVKASDNRVNPIYNNQTLNVIVDSDTMQQFTLTTDISGYIKVLVKDSSTNEILSDALVSLKSLDQEISQGYTDENGFKLFSVSDLSIPYRVVADVEGYLIKSSDVVTPVESLPNSPTVTLSLDKITPNTLAHLHIRVVDEQGRGYKFAKVALYNADTGFLTDYPAKTTNYDGNVTFNIASGNYYAIAIKGSSMSSQVNFNFDVRSAAVAPTVIVPMSISKGTLNVVVVNDDGDPIPNVKINIYDKFGGVNFNPPKALKSELSDSQGSYTTDLDADQEVFVVVSDPINGNYGSTQSSYIRILPSLTTKLKVTLYNKKSSISKPEIKFRGLFKEDKLMKGNLKAGQEYKAKFTLLIPSDRSGDDSYNEVGAIIRTGSDPLMAKDDIYIKNIEVPNAASIKKYTQYDEVDGDIDNISDEDSLTNGEAKWVKIVFDETYYNTNESFCTAYEIEATIKVKDEASFGVPLELRYLGFGLREDDQYEVDPVYSGSEDNIDYMGYHLETFSIGNELYCTDSFCFSMSLLDKDKDLRYDVSTEFAATPNENYRLKFNLVNNSSDRTYIGSTSRLLISNPDKGLDFNNIFVQFPDGHTYNTSTSNEDNEYDIQFGDSKLEAKKDVKGQIDLKTVLTGERHLKISFISDQEVQFVNDLVLNIASDKEFDVEVTPQVIPSGKEFSLQVDVKDKDTGLIVKDAYAVVKDAYNTEISGTNVPVGNNGEVSINNIPAQNSDDKVYLYIQAPGYKTFVKEITVTDKIFSTTPRNLSVSLNINTKKSEKTIFKLNNLSQEDLTIQDMKLTGKYLDIIDVQRVNNSLLGYKGIKIKGINPNSSDNLDSSKDIEVRIDVNPRAEAITEVQNLSATLNISLKGTGEGDIWDIEVPVTITVGFDGLIDSTSCMGLSEYNWEDVIVNRGKETQFVLTNGCMMNNRSIPLAGGLEAKVEFESNPLGKFILNVDNRVVELSNGYFKKLFDGVEKEATLPVIIKYEPVGRYTGDIKGKIIFRSINNTSSGEQKLISEFKFNLHVVSLADCFSISKDVVTIYDKPDTFSIENKGCGMPTVYRLSCDDCRGIVIEPKKNIEVEATGKSKDISVDSKGAIPGQYLLNVYSKVKGARGSEKNIGKIKVVIRPAGSCLDLDRYEFDLFRQDYSENTGEQKNLKAYDTANLINVCYKQQVNVEAKLKNGSRIGMALMSGIRDGLLTGYGGNLIKGIINKKGFLNIISAGVLGGSSKDGKGAKDKTQLKDKTQTPKGDKDDEVNKSKEKKGGFINPKLNFNKKLIENTRKLFKLKFNYDMYKNTENTNRENSEAGTGGTGTSGTGTSGSE